jgi:hypothetical protein
VRWLWFSINLVSLFSCLEFSSNNSMLNFSKFSDGIGFNFLVGVIFSGCGGLAISMFWGMCKVTG